VRGKQLRIVIASGKGGTGKTTVATNLAATAASEGEQVHRTVHLLDCDAEEPNCHLFVKPHITRCEMVTVPVPLVDENLCKGHGKCAEMCEFNALACIDGRVLVFTELCHSCGGCWMVCPEKAIGQQPREIGILEEGTANGFQFTDGHLRIGEAMVVPLINAIKSTQNGSGLAIYDAPPGTSCPVIATIRDSDFVILVTEPTPFGLHDLTLAVETVRKLDYPFGVIINRAGAGDDRVNRYCREEDIPILLEIPDDRRIAEAYSKGIMAITAVPEVRELFQQLYLDICARCGGGVT
jgi:MinD superfamily P-loop ATPase